MSKSEDRPYITERTRMWRTRDVKPRVLESLDLIEERGWQAMHVLADEVCPAFSYTAGLYDTVGKPELIAGGLPARTAQYAFEQAVKLMKLGLDLTVGRHRNVINETVDVMFRPVDAKWLHQVMLRADWFYDEQDVPVLQLIYPDLENWYATRDKPGDPWQRFEHPPIDGEDDPQPRPLVN